MAEPGFEFEIRQRGIVVVEGDGPDLDGVSREAWRYVAQYRSDGPLEMAIFRRRKRGRRERVVRVRMAEISIGFEPSSEGGGP